MLIEADQTHLLDDYLEAGADHLMVGCKDPFDLGPAEALLAAASG